MANAKANQTNPVITARFHAHPTKPETKNCFRFEEDDDSDGALRSLYVQKVAIRAAFGGPVETLKVEITTAETI